MQDLSSVSVILPSLDPDDKLVAVIDGLLAVGFTDIILVNDGSKPENLHYFEDAQNCHPEVHVLHHPENRGKGAALKTAFAWFLANRPDSAGVVTVDGDNQHHPEDTKACALKMLETGKLILGVRDFSQPDVPFRSRSGNRITSFTFKIFIGMTVSDTQTGLRAICRKDIPVLNTVKGDRFEYETNMLIALKEYGISYEEVSIRTVYIEENKSSHFHPLRDSWRIYKLLLAHFFKYAVSSFFCSLLDLGMVALLSSLLHRHLDATVLTIVAAAGARIVSSLANFFLNKKLVFGSHVKTGTALLRYTALVIPVMLIQILCDEIAYRLFSIAGSQTLLRTMIHLVIMIVLFLVNYSFQQRWVFSSAQKEKKSGGN